MQRLKQLRKERGLSQTKLAQRADVNPATLNRIEAGKANPHLDTLERLAGALDVPVGELFEGASPGPKAPGRPSPPEDEEGRRALADAYLTARREAHKLLLAHRRRIDGLVRRWEASDSAASEATLTPQEVRTTLRELKGLVVSGIFEIRVPNDPEVAAAVDTAALDEADRFEVEMIAKAISKMQEIAVGVIGRSQVDVLLADVERRGPEIAREIESLGALGRTR